MASSVFYQSMKSLDISALGLLLVAMDQTTFDGIADAVAKVVARNVAGGNSLAIAPMESNLRPELAAQIPSQLGAAGRRQEFSGQNRLNIHEITTTTKDGTNVAGLLITPCNDLEDVLPVVAGT